MYRKLAQRASAAFLSAIIFIFCFSTSMVLRTPAAGYNASAALAYAAAHWNDGVGLCAEFVSNCLKAGGVNVMHTVCDNLYNTLVNNGYGTAYTLTTANSKIPMSANSGKVEPGDPIFFYCNTDKSFSHVVLCGGTDSSGYITDYAHNAAHNNTRPRYVDWACDKCKTVNWTIKSVHMVKTPITAPVSPVFTTTQTTFAAGTTFGIWWNVQNGVNYSYTLYKPSGEVVIQGGCYDHITVMLAAGSYKLVVAAYNDYGPTKYGEYHFTVIGKPTWATFTSDKTTYYEGETATITFNSDTATWYALTINRNGVGKTLTDLGSTYSFIPEAGIYRLNMTAYNSAGQYDCGKTVDFTVGIYTITYDANGGTSNIKPQTKIYGTDLTLSTAKPTRTGYAFNGWNTKADGSGTAYASGATYTANANLTLYAQWSAVTLSSIAVKTNPTKTNYYVGDTLNTAGLTLTATYSDNTTQTISSGFTCTPTTLNTAGTQAVTVTYQGKTTTFNVTVTAVTLSSIAVKTMPTKTSYYVGNTLNTSGLTLTATYNNGTTQTVTSGFTCSPTVLNTAGIQAITVSYGGKSATFNVTVTDNTTAAKYTASSVKGTPGQTVKVTVSVANNPGIISLRNTVSYNMNALELVSVKNLGLLNGYTNPSPTMTSPYTLRWADSFATVNNTKNGAIAELTFKIKDTAAKGDYTITVENTEARNVSGDTVAFASGTGKITVTDEIPGDADGDGEVTDWDAILLNRYLAGWSVTVNEAACDVAGNDGVNDWDAIVLERYLAGWNVTLA